MSSRKKITVLGITGSVGTAAADMIRAASDKFDVLSVTAGRNAKALAEAAISLKAKKAVIADETQYEALKAALKDTGIACAAGTAALEEVATEQADLILAAIVGFAGLKPVLAALRAGNNVALANKEPLVAAGSLVIETARKNGARLLPVDSEHNAIFQVWEEHNRAQIEKILLTASGGPFRTWSVEQMETATLEQALKHPNWSMGSKITIDSATMMNKALEIIEAHYLFNLPPKQIEVLVHPQSIVHGIVCYSDGSFLAQMGPSDMRVPIAHALAWPERMSNPYTKLDFKTMKTLSFEPPDFAKFPALSYAYEALKSGNKACIALNAANEVAVTEFLQNRIGFGQIIRTVEHALDHWCEQETDKMLKTVEDIEGYDTMVRRKTAEYLATSTTKTKITSGKR